MAKFLICLFPLWCVGGAVALAYLECYGLAFMCLLLMLFMKISVSDDKGSSKTEEAA